LYKKYLKILQSMDLVYPDGISIVWGSRLLGGCKLKKMTGADWIFNFCQLAERSGISIYIIAGKPGVAKHACKSLINKYPKLKICGIRDGYYSEISEDDLIDEINNVSPDVVFVGMGVPIQEEWIDSHRAEISAPVCWGVGALFDYVAGIEPRVPPWMNKLGLEWLWRLIVDPLGKWKRYLIGNLSFISRAFILVITDMILLTIRT